MFEQGTFVWGVTRTAWLAIIIAVAGVAYAAMTYRRVSRQATGRDRAILIALRVSAMLLVLFCLMRPALILKAAVPQQNFLGVLVDDSRSMQIPDEGDKPRGQFIKDNFSAADSPMLAALTKRFAVRQFKFATNAERVQSSAGLTFDGTSSRLGDALDRARDELSGLPLSGLLVISDGADTADTTFEESLSQLKAQGVPVFAIGVGQEHLAHDVQISRVDTPRRVLKGTALVVDVIVMQTGYAGQKVPLNVESDGRLLAQQEITLPANGESSTFRVQFLAPDAGLKTFRFRIPQQKEEQVTQNNQRDSRLEVYDRREKILYYEGEPRFEAKFIRQALEGDENVQVVLLQRTNEKKYLRLGVDNAEELFGGFPTTRAE
nr:VWA domain-containing protein [Acidobacteriota bacterium]